MKQISPQQMIHLPVPSGASCLSVFARSPLELQDTLERAERGAAASFDAAELERIFRAPKRLAGSGELSENDFPLAVFSMRGFSARISLPVEVAPLGVVASSFHIKPLLKWRQREHPFSLLLLEGREASLYQGSLSYLRFEEQLPYSELRSMDGVFSALDRAVYRSVQSSRTPLILAGDPELTEKFQRLSGYKAILEETILVSGEGTYPAHLHRAALQVLDPYLRRRDQLFLQSFAAAERRGETVGSLHEVFGLALEGNVKHLFVSEALNLWGRLDEVRRAIVRGRGPFSGDDDVLDDLAELVIRQGGAVTVHPGEAMPHGFLACAIVRRPRPAWREGPSLVAV